jgi:hypothetical protein
MIRRPSLSVVEVGRREPLEVPKSTSPLSKEMTLEEAASTLAVSVPTVKRDWRFARAWLARRLGATKPVD